MPPPLRRKASRAVAGRRWRRLYVVGDFSFDARELEAATAGGGDFADGGADGGGGGGRAGEGATSSAARFARYVRRVFECVAADPEAAEKRCVAIPLHRVKEASGNYAQDFYIFAQRPFVPRPRVVDEAALEELFDEMDMGGPLVEEGWVPDAMVAVHHVLVDPQNLYN